MSISNKILLFAQFFLTISFAWSAESSIDSFVLDNGLKVIIKPDHRAPIVVVQIWYKVGSANESKGKRGISHLLEHMMFKSHKNPALAQDYWALTRIGARRNAYTHRDYTFYFYIADQSALQRLLHLEAERMRGIYATEQSLAIEKKIIQEEFNNQLSQDPFYFLNDLIYQQAFHSSGYQYPVIGVMEDINQLSLADLKQWHQEYYTPDNAILVISGNINSADARQWARQYFSGIKKQRSLPIKKAVHESGSHPVRYIINKPKNSSKSARKGKLLIGFRVPSIKTAQPRQETYALEVLAGWLDSGVHSRLTKILLWETPKAHDLTLHYSLMTRYDSLFIFEASPLQGVTLEQLEQAINDELAQIKQELISDTELQKVKNQMVATDIFERDSAYTQAKIIGQAEAIDVNWEEDARYIEHIKSVTPEQIQQVLKKYFIADNQVTIIQH